LLLFVAAGCGTPSSLEKQAEEVHSLAAEGALLAHDVSEGDTTQPFTRVHAGELARKADELAPKIRDTELKRVAESVGSDLGRLSDAPGDREGAAQVERRLDEAARQADEIGESAS
jgi:hypothetical protein